MQVQKYLREHGLQKLQDEFAIKVKVYDEGLIVLNYNQIESIKSHPITVECRALILDKEFNVVVEMLQAESKQLVTDFPFDVPDYEGVNGVSEKNYNRSQEEKSRYKIINPQDLSLSELMKQDELFESPFEEDK